MTILRRYCPRFWRSSVLNVKDYGARGDGITDDTVAITAARDAGRQWHFSFGGPCLLHPKS